MDFLKWVGNLFEPVVNWVTGEAGQAIASTAINGAVTGVVVGAAAAAIRGEDILHGALKGAAYGGITGGIVGALGNLSGVEGFTKESQAKDMGAGKTTQDIVEGNAGVTSKPEYSGFRNASETGGGNIDNIISDKGTSGGTPFYKTDSGAKIISGIGQGVASGAGNYLAATNKAEADKELQDRRVQSEKDKIAANQPGGILKAQTANIQVQSWWDKHLNAKTGLLNAEATA